MNILQAMYGIQLLTQSLTEEDMSANAGLLSLDLYFLREAGVLLGFSMLGPESSLGLDEANTGSVTDGFAETPQITLL